LLDHGSIQFGIIVFLFGLCIGSFLNVCIHRIPTGKSIVHPGSSCPACGNAIRFYDNIPLLSYVLLRGRCRRCRTAISPRYPAVELLAALAAFGAYARFGMSLESLVYFIFMAALLAVTFIDLDHRIIPDVITLPGIPVFFLAALLLPSISWTNSLIGVIVGGGSLYLVGLVYYLLTRKEGMGGGDVKLLAMIGALVGWQGVLFTIFVASGVGTLAGLVVMGITRGNMKLKIPFGPFLAIGAVAYVFFGPRLIHWYLHLY
jgi:leader peptidase (prepilin peptidase)/N-methyltransferase